MPTSSGSEEIGKLEDVDTEASSSHHTVLGTALCQHLALVPPAWHLELGVSIWPWPVSLSG